MPVELPDGHELNLHPGSSAASIQRAEKDLSCRLPGDYREFLLQHDGGEGFIIETYLMRVSVAREHLFRSHVNTQIGLV